MAEQNIPAFDGVNYLSVFRPNRDPRLQEQLGNDPPVQNTPEGWHVIMNGEKGRYEGIRFIEQTNVASQGLVNTDRGFFFGSDTVAEIFAIPEEIRANVRSRSGSCRGFPRGSRKISATVSDPKKNPRSVFTQPCEATLVCSMKRMPS